MRNIFSSHLITFFLGFLAEQQHIQTDLRATIAGISIVLSFHDDGDQAHDVMDANYVAAECRGLFVAMQVMIVLGDFCSLIF